jgi:DNA repair protein RecO (recombination protein O)
MLHKTRGIVINYINYRETSIITKIYTEDFGVQTYLENGVRSSKGKNKIALFQPLTLLDLVVYHDHKKEIHRISEIKCNAPYKTIPYDIRKSSMGIFINEILNKSLKEHAENKPMFQFLVDALTYLDNSENHIENFHLYFLINFCFYLGFSPENSQEMIEQLHAISVSFPFEKQTIVSLDNLINAKFGDPLIISRLQRNQILEIILKFYRLHLEDFGELRSIAVLKEVLD